MNMLRRWFMLYPVLGSVIIGGLAGLLAAPLYYYFKHFVLSPDVYWMVYRSGPSFLNVLLVGGVVGLFLGIVGGYLYKYYAKKP